MDFDDSPDEAAYRSHVRALLERHAGDLLRLEPGKEGVDARRHEAEMRTTQRVLAEAGLIGVTWPREYGGQGGTLVQQAAAGRPFGPGPRAGPGDGLGGHRASVTQPAPSGQSSLTVTGDG